MYRFIVLLMIVVLCARRLLRGFYIVKKELNVF